MTRRACAALVTGLLALASCTTVDHRPSGRTSEALGWTSVDPPIHIRQNGTVTLLGTGDLLVAGGGSVPGSTEIRELATGRVVAGPSLVTPRTGHTATLLANGKVLLAGGGTASAELYDPRARTTVATGAMSRSRAFHVAARLGDTAGANAGKVLVVGGAGDASAELFDPASGSWSAVPDHQYPPPVALATLADGRLYLLNGGSPAIAEFYDPARPAAPWSVAQTALGFVAQGTATRLASGSVVLGLSRGCHSAGGPLMCDGAIELVQANGIDTKTIVAPNGRFDPGAVRILDDHVLFVGFVAGVDTFDATSRTAGSDDSLSAIYDAPATTLVPGGDVFVLGGSQAAVERRLALGTWAGASTLTNGRSRHAAVRLHDGRVLVTGGVDFGVSGLASAELVDAAARRTAPAGTMVTARAGHTMTALLDGTVLVAGGNTANAELYDPAKGFRALPPMTTARTGHAAVLLPYGKVLVVGGDAASTAELFDPAAGTFTALPAPTTKGLAKGAVLMPNGKVLVVSGGAAEIFDPLTATFRAVTPPGSSREGPTARLDIAGRVFVAGGSALAAEVFDPATETWSYTARQSVQWYEERWGSTPDGKLIGAGGHGQPEGTSQASYVFDFLGESAGSFLNGSALVAPAYDHTLTLAGTGELLRIGGLEYIYGNGAGPASHAVEAYVDNAAGTRPTITAVDGKPAAEVVAGSHVTIAGKGFTSGPESSSGTSSSSATNHPLAYWVSDANDGVVTGTITDFTDTTATWIVPPTALHGHGQLFVGTSGVMSRGASVTITPAPAATGCANDAQCGSGFCVDGVCCDRRCDGACEGCSAAHKLSGEDGVCGAVPPGHDIYGRCVLKLGDACTEKDQCGPNFCSPQGVCCDAACTGQCLSCALAGHAGTCTAINEGACGAACDGAHTLKQVGAPDHDCAPFTCAGTQCKTTCASVRDCVAPAVCDLDGQCTPPTATAPSDVTVFGCTAVPVRTATGGGGAAWLLALALLLRRSRRP